MKEIPALRLKWVSQYSYMAGDGLSIENPSMCLFLRRVCLSMKPSIGRPGEGFLKLPEGIQAKLSELESESETLFPLKSENLPFPPLHYIVQCVFSEDECVSQ